ncbi:MAG: hypothetical protein JXM73_06345 [Anaerolineae bacterium]|nr:hypothetical protein [Anaerolineae bacterium]
MSLLHKLRTLVGALVHAPFTPRPAKAGPDPAPTQPEKASRPADSADGADLQAREPGVADTDRVADLLARRKGSE